MKSLRVARLYLFRGAQGNLKTPNTDLIKSFFVQKHLGIIIKQGFCANSIVRMCVIHKIALLGTCKVIR